MSVFDSIQDQLIEAMKNKDPKKDILRVVFGEFQRARTEPDDTYCYQIIRKMIQGNEETNKLRPSDALVKENEFLKTLLPVEMDSNEMYSLLSKVVVQIQEAKSDGQALGIAMKCLKTTGKSLNTALVEKITKNLRYA